MIFRQQFILTIEKFATPTHCKSLQLGHYHLYYHHTLPVHRISQGAGTLILLGSLFDYRNPHFSNQDILKTLADVESKEALFERLDPYCGAYILIYQDASDFIILNDCSAQKELYYTTDFSKLGAQVGLLTDLSLNHKKHAYYGTNLFNNKRLYIGETTPASNVKHLRPNHYIDLQHKKVVRFFPDNENTFQNEDMVVDRGATMLKGYLTAIGQRHELVVPVTGGMDSRMLFVASQHLEATYYISQHAQDRDDYYDLIVAKQVAAVYKQPFQIIKDGLETCVFLAAPHGIDFPRDVSFPKMAVGKAVINGNVSEVARNHFKYFMPATGKKLALLNGFEDNPFVIQQYDQWIFENKARIEGHGYHILDFFYWEENMMNWAAKGKTETQALDVQLFSPFNSRALLKLLLATPRKKRDTANNVIHAKILEKLSGGNKALAAIPLNPDFERKRARLLWKLGLFKLFDRTRLSLRLLKRRLS